MVGSKEVFMEQRESDMEQSHVTDLTKFVKPTHLTKAASEGSAEMIAALVRDGDANPLDVSTKLQWMISVLENARKLIQDDCVREIEKHNGKASINGAEVIKKETGTKYDYSGCGDLEWDRHDSAMKGEAELKKEREAFLKTLTKPLTIADEVTGEIITLNPPIKSSTTNIQVTFK